MNLAEQIEETCQLEDDEMESLNGFTLGSIFVYDSLEIILSYTQPSDLYKLGQVCRSWRNLMKTRSFWKLVFERQNMDWDLIPRFIKEQPNPWPIFQAACSHQILTRNFLKNNCGYDGVDHWEIVPEGEDGGFYVESPPEGIELLPDDELDSKDLFGGSTFVNYSGLCSKLQIVDLWSMGLTPKVMSMLLPFEFVCSETIGARFHSGGIYGFNVSLRDAKKERIVDEILVTGSHPANSGWITQTLTLLMDHSRLQDVSEIRYLLFAVSGECDLLFEGHSDGLMFTRSSVRINCLDNNKDVSLTPMQEINLNEFCEHLCKRCHGRHFARNYVANQNQDEDEDQDDDQVNDDELEDDEEHLTENINFHLDIELEYKANCFYCFKNGHKTIECPQRSKYQQKLVQIKMCHRHRPQPHGSNGQVISTLVSKLNKENNSKSSIQVNEQLNLVENLKPRRRRETDLNEKLKIKGKKRERRDLKVRLCKGEYDFYLI